MHRTYYETERQKEESRMKQTTLREMEGVTYRPSINKESTKIRRNVNDLYEWQKNRDLRTVTKQY
jgi:hypothetical protein